MFCAFCYSTTSQSPSLQVPSYASPPVSSRSGEIASLLRLLVYLIFGFTLLLLDQHGSWMKYIRQGANVVMQPIWWVVGLPGQLGTRLHEDAGTITQLSAENRQLREALLESQARLSRLNAVIADNAQLRRLLGVADSRRLDVQMASILNVDLDPTRQRLMLNAGERDGVYVGQPVIDANGLLGQIVQVMPDYSIVLLLTDPDHAVPVMVQRNGVRLLAVGAGRSDQLQIINIPLNADIKPDDVIVTSGLGGRFPTGFPVGTVTDLRADDNRAFLIGDLKPAAELDRGRHVLLLKSLAVAPPLSDASVDALNSALPAAPSAELPTTEAVIDPPVAPPSAEPVQ